jgi:hypothetical protein
MLNRFVYSSMAETLPGTNHNQCYKDEGRDAGGERASSAVALLDALDRQSGA